MGYKIALVLDDTIDTTDGVQQYVLNLGRWLTKQGHTVHYIVGESQRTDLPNLHSLGHNVKVRFNKNRMSIPLSVPGVVIRKLLSEQAFDIIHVQMPYSPFLAGKIIRLAPKNTVIVGTFHIAPHSRMVQLANIALRPLIARSLKRFDAVISVSETARDFAKTTYRLKTAVIPNMIELERFRGAMPIKQYASSTNILFFGRLVERKGCRQLLKTVNRLQRDGRLSEDIRVLVCGTGPQERALKDYVRRNHLDPLVTFTGFVAEADKAKYLAAGDVIVYPSTGGESFGIVLLEGMAAGRGIVLAGDNPGYRGVLAEHPEALFDPNNETMFAARIQTALDGPARRMAARQWQQRFVRRFDIPQAGKAIVAVYDAALHKHQR